MYFRSYGFRKTFLDKCLKSHVSQDRSKSNKIFNTLKKKMTLIAYAFPKLRISKNLLR